MKRPESKVWIKTLVLSSIILLAVAGAVLAQPKEAKYVGVNKCKNCHDAKEKGDAYKKWKSTKHALAYETLASSTAKELGKKQGIADPQKSEKCLKCHVTAFGEPAEKKDSKFDEKLGIQCETCHGPGGYHVQQRLAAAAESEDEDLFGESEEEEYIQIPDDEINKKPDEKVCIKCHNQESPSYKEFNFDEFKKKIEHPDPRKKKK